MIKFMKRGLFFYIMFTIIFLSYTWYRILSKPVTMPTAFVVNSRQEVKAKKEQAKVVAKYQILNKGKQKLILGGISTTCGCSVAAIEKSELEYNETSTIVVEGTPPSSGEKDVNIYIKTNQKDKKSIELSLKMIGFMNPPYLSTYTESINFGDNHASSRASTTFYIETREISGSPFWLGHLTSDLSNSEIELGEVGEFDLGGSVVMRHYEYKINLTTPSKPVFLENRVQVHLNKKTNDLILEIPVTCLVEIAK